jgi:hypothetical protein
MDNPPRVLLVGGGHAHVQVRFFGQNRRFFAVFLTVFGLKMHGNRYSRSKNGRKWTGNTGFFDQNSNLLREKKKKKYPWRTLFFLLFLDGNCAFFHY